MRQSQNLALGFLRHWKPRRILHDRNQIHQLGPKNFQFSFEFINAKAIFVDRNSDDFGTARSKRLERPGIGRIFRKHAVARFNHCARANIDPLLSTGNNLHVLGRSHYLALGKLKRKRFSQRIAPKIVFNRKGSAARSVKHAIDGAFEAFGGKSVRIERNAWHVDHSFWKCSALIRECGLFVRFFAFIKRNFSHKAAAAPLADQKAVFFKLLVCSDNCSRIDLKLFRHPSDRGHLEIGAQFSLLDHLFDMAIKLNIQRDRALTIQLYRYNLLFYVLFHCHAPRFWL